MVPPQGKEAKANGELSETAKGYLDELIIEKQYGRKKELYGKEITKGNECEGHAITVLSEAENDVFFKNQEQYENNWLTGCPDVIGETTIYDTKVPWDIWNFHKAEPPVLKTGKKTLYYWQLQAYMDLTGKEQAALVYCLLNTPEKLILRETQKFRYLCSTEEEVQEAIDQTVNNHNYDDLPKEDRIKIFRVGRNDEDIEALHKKVEKAREYVKNWSL
jgi:hypothetical protein